MSSELHRAFTQHYGITVLQDFIDAVRRSPLPVVLELSRLLLRPVTSKPQRQIALT